MRLHRLTVQAFGPFAGTETVDFDRLSDGGLFLVHGPTGAGKTSVLDAVCFALYGRVPGARDAARSPRSFHAPPDRRPEVELEATVRDRRLRITRSPAWERPKKRGTGTTEEKAKVVVTELVDGEWRGLTNRPDEAGQLVADLLGLSLAQFCQVVLLPQGEFARFLRADARERRDSLERIFNTGVFARVEEWLVEHARSVGARAREAEDAVRGVAERIAEAGACRAGDRPDDDDLDALVPWTAELASVTAGTARDAAEVAGAVATRRDRARAELEAARTLEERRQRHAHAVRREAELAGRAAERRAIDRELADAERAAAVLPLLRTAEQRRTQLDKAEMAVAERLSLVTELVELADPPGSVDAATPAGASPASSPPRSHGEEAIGVLLAGERARRDEVARLEQARGEADRRDEVRREIAELDGRVEAAQRELAACQQRVRELPDRRAEVAAELEEARERTGSREAAVDALDLARQRLEAAESSARLGTELAEAEQRRIEDVDAAQAAQEALLDVRRLRIEGMAAELAGGLVEGCPCPVCGSAEHPDPAGGAGGRPTPEDEEKAQRAADAARERRTRSENAVASLTERRAAAATSAAGMSEDEARELVTERQAALSELDAAAARVARASERLKELDTALEEARGQENGLSRELAELTERRAARAEEVERLTRRLDEARGDDPDLASRVARLNGEADELAAAAEAVRARDAAAEELRAAEREAERGREEAGFTDVDSVWAAERDEASRRELRERARAHDDELAAVRATLADPDLAAAGARPAPDLAGLAEVLRAAEQEAEEALSWRDRYEQRARRLADLRAELDRRLAGSRPERRRHAVADGLARLAAGTSPRNRESVRLSAYVLAARLEQVVAAANDRLRTMSGGRYELRHTVDKAVGDRSRSGGGLGLRVVDAWTGQDRAPETLSGGETFISSLALALGLGDVATEEAGGTDIGTLFVDEGFGTLDEETLDEVLAVLDTLRDGGRAVGVVSHVADLRTRVTTRLRVTKSPQGSKLSQTG